MIITVGFLKIVFGSTVFTRAASTRQYELKTFWLWHEVIQYHDWKLLEENLLKCILLISMGMMLPAIFDHKVKISWAFLQDFGYRLSLNYHRGSFKGDCIK